MQPLERFSVVKERFHFALGATFTWNDFIHANMERIRANLERIKSEFGANI